MTRGYRTHKTQIAECEMREMDTAHGTTQAARRETSHQRQSARAAEARRRAQRGVSEAVPREMSSRHSFAGYALFILYLARRGENRDGSGLRSTRAAAAALDPRAGILLVFTDCTRYRAPRSNTIIKRPNICGILFLDFHNVIRVRCLSLSAHIERKVYRTARRRPRRDSDTATEIQEK